MTVFPLHGPGGFRLPHPPLLLCLLLLLLFLQPGSARSDHFTEIVILNSYHQGFTWTDQQVEGISRFLRAKMPEVELRIQYMDAKRFPDRASLERFRDYFSTRLPRRNVDLVFTTDHEALGFALAQRDALFPGVPIVFAGNDDFRPEMLKGQRRVTGVVGRIDLTRTLEAAFRLQPEARTVLAVFDGTPSGRREREAARKAASRFRSRAEFRFLEDPTLEEVLTEVRRLSPKNSFVLLGSFNRDRRGAAFSHEEALEHIRTASPAPVYGLWDFLLGRGIVGGDLLSGQLLGEHAARLGLRMLAGERGVPVERMNPARLAFDYRQLQRFALDPAALPPGSAVENRPPSLYEEHGDHLLAAGAIILALSGIIALLLLSASARRRAEAGLREKSYLLQAIIDALPAPVFYKDENGIYLGCNAAFERFMGKPRAGIVGQSVYGVSPPDLAEIYERVDRELFAQGETQVYETTVQHADGSRRDVMFHKAVFTKRDGSLGGLVGAMLDITDRKWRERELEALARVASALRSADSSEDMHPILLDCLMGVAKVNGAFLLLREAESGQVARGAGTCASLTGQELPAASVLFRPLFQKGQPFLGQRYDNILLPLPEGVEHLAAFPMIAHDRTIGALCCSRLHPFLPAELRLLGSVAEMGASALHRAILHEHTELQIQRLSALRNIDRAIIGSHDFGLTLEVLLEQVIRQMRVDAASVLLFHPDLEILEFAAGQGFLTSHIRRSRLRPGEGLAGRAVRNRRLVSVTGARELRSQSLRTELVEKEGFVFYCGVPLIARGEIKGVLELFHRTPQRRKEDWLEFLEALGMQAAIALDNALLFEGLQRSNADLVQAYDQTIEGWSRVLDLRDRETEGHSRRVMEMTVRLALEMGIAEGELAHIRRGALLHDIGKMGIPDAILLKPAPLAEEEWAVMKTHPRLAYDFLSPIDHLRPALDIPYCHHEKWDGSGYPRGLKGEQIPLPARIFAVVDVWDALSSDRPYRPAWSAAEVRRLIREEAGRHFDPRVVETFLSLNAG